MRTMANYLIIMLTIILFVFRLVVVFTTTMEMDFSLFWLVLIIRHTQI